MFIFKLGKEGRDLSFLDMFPKKIECNFCGGKARLAFAAREQDLATVEDTCVYELHDIKPAKFWPRDRIAAAVYICQKCRRANALWDEA